MIGLYRAGSRDRSKTACRPLSGRPRFGTRWGGAVVRLFFLLLFGGKTNTLARARGRP